jgi:hypothetical protein
MAIDKSLYEAPVGLGAAAGPDLEIEIENPDMVTLDDGSVEITLTPGSDEDDNVPFDANLAEHVDEGVLAELGADLISDYDNDLASRKEWERTYTEGLKLLGLQYEERTEPWNGACGVFHPMLTEAVVRFQSETIMETFPAMGPVKTQIIGKQTKEKEAAATRVQDDMNYQLTEVMVEYRPEHEKMLWNLPIAGSAFKKVYFDPALDRQVSMFIPAEDVILPYGTSEMSLAPRITHRMRKSENEIKRLINAEFYRDVELGEPSKQLDDIQKAKDKETGFSADHDDRFQLLEIQVELDLEGFEHEDEEGEQTGIALPYIVTLLKDTKEVLAIRRNWKEEDETHQKRQHMVHYQYIPGFGAYGFGLIHLIGGATKSATSITRQLVDAGTLSNLPGGMKTRGLRIKGDDTPIAPGEFRDVDITSGSLRDNIVPLPYKEPSQTLLALMNQIVDDARRFAAVADMKVADMSANAPVGTTLAILERMLKVMSAVQARLHYSLKQELKLLAGIIRDYTEPNYDYDAEGPRGAQAKESDYSLVEVIPVSDPNAATMSQRVVQYQAVMQMAEKAPQIYNQPYLHRQMLEVLGVKHADKLVPIEDDMKPVDPVTENMEILKAKPVKAFLEQDHEAHLSVHMAMMQDPKIQQVMGQNPQAQMLMGAMQAHIAEHAGFAYRKKIEEQLGVPLPLPGKDQDPEIERELAPLIAQAAQQLLKQNQIDMAQQQQAQAAQQAAQDPSTQIDMQKLQLEGQKVAIQQKKLEMDAAAKADQIDVERERIASQERIAGVQVGSKVAHDKASLAAKQQAEGLRIGADVARTKAQMTHQANQSAQQAQQPKKESD